ncbi:tripartite tricarboxylate transporter substrate binding protein [Roseomonas sp. NAR14]|uniref:Tripartite tricarboxylate transporter substrate binding protein n=1 Tax=Roseomonas acroporae TaxID=2937791 RepID=A0A9X2BYT9_9PROT|nr:tripartite tricarboxylate transporter substrate binding protein [Roseomonas acroporae]MCK8786390.1 tripartite tricarboxylate transporter substrate binding protein [Roseomonas acroporae]
MQPCSRRATLAAALLAALPPGLMPRPAPAQPAGRPSPLDGPVTLICPFAAGGGTDLFLRALAAAAAPRLGQPVLVENRPGAAGSQGAIAVARAFPDGRLIAALPISALRQQAIRAESGQTVLFDAARDFTHLLQLAGYTFGLAVRADDDRFPDWAGFLAEARRQPGALRYAHWGTNGSSHVAMEMIAARAGVSLAPVEENGDAEGVAALLDGRVDAVAGTGGLGVEVDRGVLRWLNLWSDTRSMRWPDVPTLLDLGYGMVVTSPFGLVAPLGLPADTAAALHDAFAAALRDPQVQGVLELCVMTTAYLDPLSYAAFLGEEAARQRALVRRLGLRAG